MNKLRGWISALLLWLLFFYNIERFHEPINLASFVYVYAAAVAIAVVAVRRFRTWSSGWLLAAAVVVLLIIKASRGYVVLGHGLPLTITECCAIGVTLFLARGIAASIHEFERGALDVMTLQLNGSALAFETGQTEIYREIRRAREFARPLTMVALTSRGTSTSAAINRLLEEVQRLTIRRYVDARLADLLANETRDCDIVTQRDDHFVLVLPEADRARAASVAEHLKSAAQEKLGLQLEAGVATFPDEEVTLTGLLERAVAQMRMAGQPGNGAATARKVNGSTTAEHFAGVAANGRRGHFAARPNGSDAESPAK
jgi:hypothetical protein